MTVAIHQNRQSTVQTRHGGALLGGLRGACA
jgi:hypothetical protein